MTIMPERHAERVDCETFLACLRRYPLATYVDSRDKLSRLWFSGTDAVGRGDVIARMTIQPPEYFVYRDALAGDPEADQF